MKASRTFNYGFYFQYGYLYVDILHSLIREKIHVLRIEIGWVFDLKLNNAIGIKMFLQVLCKSSQSQPNG